MSLLNSLVPYGRFARGYLTRNRPIYLHFAVTHRCNLRCRMCAAWKLADPEHEITVEEVNALAAAFGRMGCIHVSLGGGEPFMRDDLPEIIRAFTRASIRVRVLTNGVASTPDRLERAAAAGMHDISISLDSLRPKLQAHIDGRPDTFRRKLETIALLHRLLPAKGSQPLLNTVVSRYNLDEIPALLEFARAIGFAVSLIPIHSAESAVADDRFRTYAPDMLLPDRGQRAIERLYHGLLREKRRGAPIINSGAFLKLSREYFTGRADRFPCDAGKLYFSVSPRGNLSICHDTEATQSLPLDELPRLLRSKSYECERRALAESCSGCIRPCWAEITYMVHDPGATWEMVKMTASAARRREVLSLDSISEAARTAAERHGIRLG